MKKKLLLILFLLLTSLSVLGKNTAFIDSLKTNNIKPNVYSYDIPIISKNDYYLTIRGKERIRYNMLPVIRQGEASYINVSLIINLGKSKKNRKK